MYATTELSTTKALKHTSDEHKDKASNTSTTH
jgi:hypothetical protein